MVQARAAPGKNPQEAAASSASCPSTSRGPHPLPPREPPLRLEGALPGLLARASESLRLLELAGDLVPSVEWFSYSVLLAQIALSAIQVTFPRSVGVEAVNQVGHRSSWQVGVEWNEVLPADARCLALAAAPEAFASSLLGLVERHAAYDARKLLPAIRKVASPAQAAELDRLAKASKRLR